MKYRPTLLKIEPPTGASPSRGAVTPGVSSPPNAMSRSEMVMPGGNSDPIKLLIVGSSASG